MKSLGYLLVKSRCSGLPTTSWASTDEDMYKRIDFEPKTLTNISFQDSEFTSTSSAFSSSQHVLHTRPLIKLASRLCKLK